MRQQNETFQQLAELLAPANSEINTVQGELIQTMTQLWLQWYGSINENWEAKNSQHGVGFFQRQMNTLCWNVADEPSQGFVEVFDESTIQKIQRDLSFLNLSAVLAASLPATQEIRRQILQAAHSQSEAVVWEQVKEAVQKWLEVHSQVQDEQIKDTVARVKDAFQILYNQWSVQENTGWDAENEGFNFNTGLGFYQNLVNYLWRHLLPANSPLLGELGLEAPHNFTNPFNKSELESISRDLVFINLLGYYHVVINITDGQKAAITNGLLPNEPSDSGMRGGVYRRLEQRIVDWCAANPKLFALSEWAPEISNQEQMAYSQILAAFGTQT